VGHAGTATSIICTPSAANRNCTDTTITYPTVTYRRYDNAKPFANFARVIEFQSSASSRYNGYTVDFSRRMTTNWQARLAYTWSKVEDDRPDATAVVPGGSDDAKNAQDPFNLRGDWAPGDNDVRHRVVLSGVWDLDTYASKYSGVAKGFLGGWSVSGIVSYQTGQPFSALVSRDLNNDGNSRSDRAPETNRNAFRLPSQFSVDPRVTKTVGIFNGVGVQLIAEAFNALNRSNVSGVRTTFYGFDAASGALVPQSGGATAFGSPSVSSGPRILQFAAKVTF
jgi:hypothetical protein